MKNSQWPKVITLSVIWIGAIVGQILIPSSNDIIPGAVVISLISLFLFLD